GWDFAEIAAAWWLLHFRRARMTVLRRANLIVDAERNANLLAQNRAKRAPIRALRDGAGDVAPCHWMIAAGRAGWPQRLKRGDRFRAGWRIEPQIRIDGLQEARHAGLMRKRLADGHTILAVNAERGPQPRNRCVIIQRAPISEQSHHQRADALAGRIHGHDRVFDPRPRLLTIGPAAPEIDDHFAITDRGKARAHFLSEANVECIAHALETRRDIAFRHHAISKWRARGHVTGSSSNACASGNSKSSLSAAIE